jgi:hypothetical protein
MRAAHLAVFVFAFSSFSFAMTEPFAGNTLQASYTIITTLSDQSSRSTRGGVTLYFDNRGRVFDYNNTHDRAGVPIGLNHWVKDPTSIQRIYFFGQSVAIEDIEEGGKGGLIVFTKSDSGCSISVKFMNDLAVKSEVQTDYCRILPGHIDPIASK